MSDKYRLGADKKIIQCESVFEWAEWYETADGIVKQEHVGDKWVSTVFLGLDHRFYGEGPPILFETMVRDSDGSWLDYQDRYCTWDEALAGHNQAVEWVKNGCIGEQE